MPTNAFSRELSWSSSDDTILYIDEFSGMFVALSEGTVTITATATDGSGVSATATVYVGQNNAIIAPAIDRKVQTTIYNLQGQKLLTPRKGIYIINGKKVIIK